MRAVEYVPGLRILDVAKAIGYLEPSIVLRNGAIEKDLSRLVAPGDMIHVVPVIQEPITAIITTIAEFAAAAGSFFTGMFETIGGIVGGLTAGNMAAGAKIGAIVGKGILSIGLGMAANTVGGLIINALMPPPGMGTGSPPSPTYGWGPQNNPGREGAAIPVVYGEVMSYPVVIGQYIEVGPDESPYASSKYQWIHTLLAVHEGPTNNMPTANDIWANDEPLALLYGYDVKATDGSNTPDTSQFNKFQKLHQYRALNKLMGDPRCEEFAMTLLHLNGDNGSTTIAESSIYGNVYTCQGGAALSTTHPFLGSANLDATVAGDYVTCDLSGTFGLFNSLTLDWDVEFRFRQAVLTDGVIVGQQRIDAAYEFYWAISYNGGNLEFMCYKRVNSGGWLATTFFNVSGAASLSVDTWHHVRVCKFQPSGETDYTVRLFVDGQQIASGIQATTLETPASGTWSQQIGRGYRLETGSAVQYDGLCEIDEFRIVIGQLLYDVNGFTPPSTELEADLIEYVMTKGIVDEITLTIEAPRGIFYINNDAELEIWYTILYYAYRKVGDSTWTGAYKGFSGASREALWTQWTIILPERAQYEIKMFRTTAFDEDTRHQSSTYWIGLDEILNEFLSYPNIQVVQIGLQAQDRLSGQIPTYRVRSNITQIIVPTFDGASTQTVDPRTPKWAAFDMLTNSLSGAGVSADRFEEDAMNDWGDWTEGLVAGNYRARLNMIFDAEYDMDNALQQVENVGRARLVRKGTKISVAIEKPGDPVMLYSAGNIVEGQYELKYLPQSERVDAIDVEYLDRNKNWTRQTAFARSTDYESLTIPARTARVFIPGINNEEQAKREAILRMQLTEMLKRSIEFGAGLDAIRCVLGDLFYFQHGGNSATIGGRLAEDVVSSKRVRLDQTINLAASEFSGNCKIWIRKADDTIEELTVSGPWDTNTEIIMVGTDLTASRFDVFMIGKSVGEKHTYRLMRQARDSKQTYSLRGLEYDEDVYYHADYESGEVAI
jgi:hypothetical protein